MSDLAMLGFVTGEALFVLLLAAFVYIDTVDM